MPYIEINRKSRDNHPLYLKNSVERLIVNNYISWNIKDDDYSNEIKNYKFTHDAVLSAILDVTKDDTFSKKCWADPDIESITLIKDNGWSTFNHNKRISYDKTYAKYLIDGENGEPLKSGIKGAPLYPGGRTGLCGRGLLGKWGPNHAADPIITRHNPKTNKLEMIGIIRSDTRELALPGGMVDPGEKAKTTALRELFEEAFANDIANDNNSFDFKTYFENNAVEIYRGCVDDPRNTDNAWLETSVYHLHVTDPDLSLDIEKKLKSGDDAISAKFICIEPMPVLYASHEYFVKLAIERIQNNPLIDIIRSKVFSSFITGFYLLILFSILLLFSSYK